MKMTDHPGWTRLSPPGDKCRALWQHRSGWQVLHCGHPTANWPYYALQPGDNRMVVSGGGRGFRTLADAFAGVAAVQAGRAQLNPHPSRYGELLRVQEAA